MSSVCFVTLLLLLVFQLSSVTNDNKSGWGGCGRGPCQCAEQLSPPPTHTVNRCQRQPTASVRRLFIHTTLTDANLVEMLQLTCVCACVCTTCVSSVCACVNVSLKALFTRESPDAEPGTSSFLLLGQTLVLLLSLPFSPIKQHCADVNAHTARL